MQAVGSCLFSCIVISPRRCLNAVQKLSKRPPRTDNHKTLAAPQPPTRMFIHASGQHQDRPAPDAGVSEASRPAVARFHVGGQTGWIELKNPGAAPAAAAQPHRRLPLAARPVLGRQSPQMLGRRRAYPEWTHLHTPSRFSKRV